jgi:hypothetical protein
MPIITEIDQYGNPQTRITFDHAAYAQWKAKAATWRRNRYATDPAYRAARQAARRKSDAKRADARKAATAATK